MFSRTCKRCKKDFETPTHNKVYCSTPCRNRDAVKRHKEKNRNKCNICSSLLGYNNSSGYCRTCRNTIERERILNSTIGEFKYTNRGATNRYTRLRDFSRRYALEHLDSPSCFICNYDTFIEVCHIKDIADFPDEALVREVNALSNLTILCPNHHKEFDKGLLDSTPLSIEIFLS